MWILIFFLHFSFADCEIPEPIQPVPEGYCPVTMNHLERIKTYYNCRQQRVGNPGRQRFKAVGECHQKAKAMGSTLPFISAAMFAKMNAREKALAMSDFFKSESKGISEDIAKEQFERDYKKPADRRKLNILKIKHNQLKVRARSGDEKARIALRKFETDRNNRSYLRALEAHKGDVSKVRQPVYRYALRDIVGGQDLGKAKLYDIANMKFADIPPDILESHTDHNSVIKQRYYVSADRIVGGIKEKMQKGIPFDKIKRLDGVSGDDLHQAQRRFQESSMRFRDQVLRSSSNDNYPRVTKKIPKTSKFPGLSKLLKIGGGVGLTIQALSIPWQKQAQCDKTFPLYPVNYSPSAVIGLPEESNCHMQLPSIAAQAPEKINSFLALSSQEQHKALIDRENRQTRYTCRYYRRLYNHLFCQKSGSEDSGIKSER